MADAQTEAPAPVEAVAAPAPQAQAAPPAPPPTPAPQPMVTPTPPPQAVPPPVPTTIYYAQPPVAAAPAPEPPKPPPAPTVDIEAQIKARDAVLMQARPYLPADYDLVGKSNRDILKDAVGGEVSDDHDDSYLLGRLSMMSESRARAESERANATQSIQNAAASMGLAPGQTPSTREQGYLDYSKRLTQMWREGNGAAKKVSA